MPKIGKIVVIIGPMFAGKTTRLLKEIQKARKGSRKAVLFKSGIDNRYGESEVVTHDGARLPAMVLPDGERCISVLRKAAKEYDIIGIDEGQFWDNTDGLVEELNRLASNSKSIYISMLNSKAVYIPMLNRKLKGELFDIGYELLACADHIYTLRSKCWKCGRKASFTQRITPWPKSNNMADFVGGAKDYQPICSTCLSKIDNPGL
ncbi:thymidine kinase [Candidatus Marsarchaeota archaeon]|nr:thymidine kinase [Candidatus Marsarchaeota archaeon]